MPKRKAVIIAGIIGGLIGLMVVTVLVVGLRSQSVLPTNPHTNADIKLSTYEGEYGWGYDVYVDGALLIHQPNIPALAGNRGFATEGDARRVAELVVDKFKNSLLPTLTIEELRGVGVVE